MIWPSKVIKGGLECLTAASPVVFFAIGQEAFQALTDLGYGIYKYLSSLNTLVPFDADVKPDRSVLKLVAVRQEQAEALKACELLITENTSLSVEAVIEFKLRI